MKWYLFCEGPWKAAESLQGTGAAIYTKAAMAWLEDNG